MKVTSSGQVCAFSFACAHAALPQVWAAMLKQRCFQTGWRIIYFEESSFSFGLQQLDADSELKI
jgi:hypothetical protein